MGIPKVLCAAVVVIVLSALAGVSPAEAASHAPKSARRQRVSVSDLWTRLHRYEKGYLRLFFAAEETDSPTAANVLNAFNELAYQITGPGGFWRKQVPGQWLGCKGEVDSASCDAISVMVDEMARWDALQDAIQATTEADAARFLVEHGAELVEYLEVMVPDEASSPGMQRTPYFEKHLKAAMQADGIL